MYRQRFSTVWALGLLLSIVSVGHAQDGEIRFVDVSAEAGITFVHSFGDQHMSNIVEATGPGCAFLDYDVDGHPDLYVVNGSHVPEINDPYPEGRDPAKELLNVLYRNKGDGTFVDVTGEAGVGDRGYGMGVVVGDYDNNGYPDIYVCNYGPNVLYRNNGDGTFTDVTEQAGVGCAVWSVHGTFLDYDSDGYIDLYVGNYLQFDPEYRLFFGPEGFPGPLAYQGVPDVLYRNNGDGTFTDVTERAGVDRPEGRAMSVTSADYDNDGDMDIFVANDAMENDLHRNNGDGTFANVALETRVALGGFGESTSSMGPTFADIDNDGDLDLFVPDMGFSALYRNDGDGFEEIAATAGIAEIVGQYTSWAGTVFDYDNDGDQDIFISNGDAHHIYTEEDLLLRNNGDGTFTDVSLQSGDYFSKAEYVGRGAAVGDYDNDGDLDILVANVNGPAILLRNEGGDRGHYLQVRTVGTQSNRDGIGARVTVAVGSRKQVACVTAGINYLSNNDLRVHFGLGEYTQVDLLEIRWPSGIVQTLHDLKADQILTLTEPDE